MKKTSVSRSPSAATAKSAVKPRKMPRQARSTATVQAIREACFQVLLERGAHRLTTTLVAVRAGVSVGTLYQYFPHKRALLHEVLREHLSLVAEAVERVCALQHGQPVDAMARALVRDFVSAKLRDVINSVALYSVADLGDSESIIRDVRRRTADAIGSMLRSAPDVFFPDLETTVLVLYTSMAAVTRAVLERGASRASVAAMRSELTLMAEGHLIRSSRPKRRLQA